MSGEVFELSVPMLAPGINHCYGQTRFGGKYLKPKGKAFKALVRAMVGSKRLDVQSPMSLTIELHGDGWWTKKGAVHLRGGDVDGFCKISIDALAEALMFNDALIFDLRVQKFACSCERTVFRLVTMR